VPILEHLIERACFAPFTLLKWGCNAHVAVNAGDARASRALMLAMVVPP
jgi:hypothetical protein